MSGHLLNLDSNYIHVIWVEQLLQETQTFTRGFLCMLVREELKFFSTSVRTSPFPSLKTLVSGLVGSGVYWLLVVVASLGFWLLALVSLGFWPWPFWLLCRYLMENEGKLRENEGTLTENERNQLENKEKLIENEGKLMENGT